MSQWSLSELLAGLHQDIETQLSIARRSFGHPGTKGDATEGVWLQLLQRYLPQRYQAASAHVVDSTGAFSEQIDVVVFDRQYSPFIFRHGEQLIIPAESVYAVFEAKQSINAAMIAYAQVKVASVRDLHRTSLPIPHAGGTYPPKALTPILGGILTLGSDWNPPLGEAMQAALVSGDTRGRLDLGCVASHGVFHYDETASAYNIHASPKPATAFLFKLIARLQMTATVPMIDINAYGAWLEV